MRPPKRSRTSSLTAVSSVLCVGGDLGPLPVCLQGEEPDVRSVVDASANMVHGEPMIDIDQARPILESVFAEHAERFEAFKDYERTLARTIPVFRLDPIE